MRGKLEKAITDKIYVTEDGIRREVTAKHNMEQVCKEENIKIFTQTYDTPPLTYPILGDLGILAEGPAVQDIFAGTYVPSVEFNIYATQLLQHLEIPKATL